MTMNVNEFLSYIKEAKSKATYKNYKQGVKKFVEWYGKSANEILKERFKDLQSTELTERKRFNREIEKFHRHLKNLGHPQNTCVAYTEGIRQLFRFLEIMGIANGTLFNAGFQDDFSMKLILDANATRGTYTITVTAEGRDA